MSYNVPTNVAVTTALAAGGTLFGSAGASPANATAIDAPTSHVPTTVAAAGSLLITLAAVPVGKQGIITALGLSSTDFVNTRITTRVDGMAVAPLIQEFGAIGPMENPTPLASAIRLGPGQVFSLLLENVGVANIDMAARILGFNQ